MLEVGRTLGDGACTVCTAGTEVAESASLYSPSVEFGDVVLPEAVSAKLQRMLSSHAALRAYNKRVGLAKDIPQPDGLVLLLSVLAAYALAALLAHRADQLTLYSSTLPAWLRPGRSGAWSFARCLLLNCMTSHSLLRVGFALPGHTPATRLHNLHCLCLNILLNLAFVLLFRLPASRGA